MDTIIFDVDDTMYDQLQPFKIAFERQFKHIKKVPIEKLYISSRKHSDTLFNESEAGTISLAELHTYRIKTACKDFGIEISDQEALEFQRAYENEQKKIVLFPEIERLFELLSKKDKQLALLTNGPYEHQRMKIDQLGLTRWVPKEHIFISGAIGSAKPAPEAFLIVEKTLRLGKEKTVYIGDSFENDVAGAKRVGWNAIWMNHRKKELPLSAIQPDKIITTPNELLELVDCYL
jgi:putative hydrolase of the HAD superfamily